MTSGTITTFSATDASNVVWSLGAGNDSGEFVISQSGELLFRQRRHLRIQRMMRRLMITSREVIATDATGRSSTRNNHGDGVG